MRRALLRALRIAFFPTIAFAVALGTFPDRRELVLHVSLLVVLGGALVAGLKAVRAASPSSPPVFDARAAGVEGPPGRFVSLARLEREVSMASTSAYDLHVRLRPTLREVALGLLATRRGIDLDRTPERAREILGDDTWELVRGDRRPPEDGRAPGLDLPSLDRVVSSLERL
ncbi:MAG TPA: hypothetical protein VH572_00870 [Gaiella sp.]|jgi:hypothetical protein